MPVPVKVLVFKDPVYDEQGNLVDISVDGIYEIEKDPKTGNLLVKKVDEEAEAETPDSKDAAPD